MRGLSLFANVGIAETYLEELGIEISIANELLENRCRFYKHCHPKTKVIKGDITNPFCPFSSFRLLNVCGSPPSCITMRGISVHGRR